MKWLTVFLAAIALSATTHAAERVLFFSPIMGKPSQQAKYAAVARTAAKLAEEWRALAVSPSGVGTGCMH